jgi:hypothetical protein
MQQVLPIPELSESTVTSRTKKSSYYARIMAMVNVDIGFRILGLYGKTFLANFAFPIL